VKLAYDMYNEHSPKLEVGPSAPNDYKGLPNPPAKAQSS
jgi:hypothetical protein